jgi:capsular polysaccharide export protein
MTSLAGFDALLRGRKVVTYGTPFYAGWGLTEDLAPSTGRRRSLTLDALVAGSLLLYPRYWDSRSGGFVEIETILERIVAERSRSGIERAGSLASALRRRARRWLALARGLWAAYRATF